MNTYPTIDKDEIDLKEVFSTLNRYKYSIIIFMIVFTIGSAVFAYFTPQCL
ncbi:Wzz/FepE/Etk N-terminal domain-containing protein [Sulfurimonas sp. HSL3-7]|uniref:Wzz/FepE/Etk N-terminal domain-containing protein n=1 Tax=Sulfonitrofixus jiaomeiensis TaxID=3131938 RepID=UPI0031F92F16